MTVFELIKELAKYNHDAEVLFSSDIYRKQVDGDFWPVEVRYYLPHAPERVVLDIYDE
jgi:hypothetical protein